MTLLFILSLTEVLFLKYIFDNNLIFFTLKNGSCFNSEGKRRTSLKYLHLIFWLFLKAALNEVARFDNGIAFQVKIKAEILCLYLYYNGIFTVKSYKVLITLRICNFMSLQAFAEFSLVRITETKFIFILILFFFSFAVYGVLF